MTPNTRDTDKVLDHTRLQLSALIDGELPLDEARFLLRRIEHDTELRDCWERWQLCGDVMRGRIGDRADSGFAARVTVAIAAEPIAASGPAARHRWLRLGGGAALAASVAMIALFMSRQSPELRTPAPDAQAQIASNPVPAPMKSPAQPPAATPAPAAPGQAAEVASALAVADVPRRLATRRSRGQSQRAAQRVTVRAEMPVAVAATTQFATPAIAADPFSGQHLRLPNRPWPRALLPSSPANGAFTVDYGSRAESSGRPLSPFAPVQRQLPVAPQTNDSEPTVP